MLIRDQRGLVGDWLVKLVLGFLIFGVIAFDAGSIIVNHFTLDSAARDVAIAVSLDIGHSRPSSFTANELYRLAREEASNEQGEDANVLVLRKGTLIDPEGVVHVRVRRVANTLIVKRVGAVKDWAIATADGQAGTN